MKESAPQLCHHCEDAPCAGVCPVNTITALTALNCNWNENRQQAQKLCGIACPFGAIEFSGSRRCIFRQMLIPESAACATGSGTREYAAGLGAGHSRRCGEVRSVRLR